MGSRCRLGCVASPVPNTPARLPGDVPEARGGPAARSALRRAVLALCAALLTACAGLPLVPYSKEAPPLVLVPAAQAGVWDGRARFREIFCAVLVARAAADAAGMHCEEALVRLSDEPARTGAGVDLAVSRAGITLVFVPGFASDCVGQARTLSGEAKDTLARSGYGYAGLPVSGLASSAYNTSRVRDAVLRIHATDPASRVVIVAHSKGAVDTLEALVAYPELRAHVAAVISLAGAVGGSPLANLAPA